MVDARLGKKERLTFFFVSLIASNSKPKGVLTGTFF